ncbi:MAG: cystathionine gamma-synthase [Candidatus Marinimicrobia bacterium]|nr:cystathionine gamma-synthase [Candidatus Neomarinimicrobiota bacterium]
MSKTNKLGFNTKAVHVGNEPDSKTGAVIPPIFATTTYVQDGIGQDRGYDYSRAVNPTRQMHEENIAALENGNFGIAFSSGMAATNALFQTFEAGDHFVVSRNTYGGTYRVLEKVFKRHGFDVDFVDTRELDAVKKTFKPNTKMVFIETPTNPLLEITDIQSLSEICKNNNVLLGVDNTFMSPYGQRPLELGANVVMHSTTKFIGGHSDLLGGILITNKEELAENLHFIQKSCGAIPSAFDCWLLLRSSKTLSLRVQRQCDTAMKLAQWLEKQDLDRVIYPGLASFPQHDLAAKQQLTPDGKPIFGSIISIDLGTIQARDNFLAKLNVFFLAESLGGVESLISNPFNMTHGDVPEDKKLAMSITEGLIRLSIGIEDFSDLKNDLQQAL